MDRREALMFFAKSMGVAVTLPTGIATLTACQVSLGKDVDSNNYSLVFLSNKQYQMVSGISDVILPESEIVGAEQLKVAQFIDQIISETMTSTQQKHFIIGAEQFERELNYHCQQKPNCAQFNHYQSLVSLFFSIPKHKQQQIFSQQMLAIEDIAVKDVYDYYLYKFLLTTRELTLLGYYTSEYVGENIMNYDPVPDTYQPCIDVTDVDNAWSS